MALFFVGYLIAITSTIAFIVAILTPRWIYPNTQLVNGIIVSSTSDSSYRGIFSVNLNFGNTTCEDWILLPKDSIEACRQRKFDFVLRRENVNLLLLLFI